MKNSSLTPKQKAKVKYDDVARAGRVTRTAVGGAVAIATKQRHSSVLSHLRRFVVHTRIRTIAGWNVNSCPLLRSL